MFANIPQLAKTAFCIHSNKLGRVTGVMAMGVSTPSGPFKPSCSSFWFSSPPCRILGSTMKATMAASSSPLAPSFPKFHQRRDLHLFQSKKAPCISTTNCSSSNEFRTNSSYSTGTGMREDMMRMTDNPGESSWQLVVLPAKQNGSSSSLAKMLRKESTVTHPKENILSAPSYCQTHPDTESLLKQAWLIESKIIQKAKEESKKAESNGSVDGSDYTMEGLSLSSKLERAEGNGLSQQVRPSIYVETFHVNSGVTSFSPTRVMDLNDSDMNSRNISLYNSMNGPIGVKGDALGKEFPLNQDTMSKTPSNGSRRGDMEHAVHIADKVVTKHEKPRTEHIDHRKNLSRLYDEVLVINNVLSAKKIVQLLTTTYRDCVHACDTEVSKIDVKHETPVDHGEIICFSIYSGSGVDFGNGKSCIWVDVLDGGGRELLMEFAPFFEDSSIKKVWHNYGFDSHVVENYGIKMSGFHADTMHMARLWDSARRTEGGYSLEALTSDSKVMDEASDSKVINGVGSPINRELIGKTSMKTIFGKKKLKKDGYEGKLTILAPVEELQREEQILWICYSALDSISTLQLFESLKSKLTSMQWDFNGKVEGTMYQFYEKYWRPFGELLVKMETEGMLVDLAYLSEIQKVATTEQQISANRFRTWAAKYCPDAVYMNVGSDAQLRQLFFGGTKNSKDPNEFLPFERTFKVPNVDNVIEEGKKVPSKFRSITLHNLGRPMETEMYTASGWPSVSGDALKTLAGKLPPDYDWDDDAHSSESDCSSYGKAYEAFDSKKENKDACHAIAALCEICSIDSLISNFILPLQSNNISGRNKRVHCSLNINTETGRLSARRPNLQNQPALEKDRYKIRQAFIAAPGNSLIVADYGQLELRILAHLANCKSMKEAFKAGGDFHSRTAMNMYSHIRDAVEKREVLLEWHPQPGEVKPPVPLLKDAFASERRKAKMLNFSIAYGKTPVGLAHDWKVSVKEAKATVALWYSDRKEVSDWQKQRKAEANKFGHVKTLLGRTRNFPSMNGASNAHKGHIERAAINTPVQGSAADVAMCAMLEIANNARLKELGWRLLLQVHDEVILEGPTESAEVAKAIVIECMSKPFNGRNILDVELVVDAKCAQNWYAAK